MKKIALLLAAVMVAAMVPATAFARTDNHVSNTVKVKTDSYLKTNAPTFVAELEDGLASGVPFELVLDGAEWKVPVAYDGATPAGTLVIAGAGNYVADAEVATGYVLPVGGKATYTDASTSEVYNVTLLDAQTLSFSLTGEGIAAYTQGGNSKEFTFPMEVKVTAAEATVTVDPGHTAISAGKYTFAVTGSANATAKVNGVATVEVEGGATPIKSIVVSETITGALEAGKAITLKLYGNYEYGMAASAVKVTDTTGNTGYTVALDTVKEELTITVPADRTVTAAGKLSITGIAVAPVKGIEAGDVAEIVVKGAGVEATTLEVAKAVTYGVSFTVADKKLPVFYAGRKYTTDETLTVTFKELAEDSWWTARKTTLTFPEGVNVVKADIHDTKNMTAPTVKYDYNKVELSNVRVTDGEKAEFQAEFVLSISPDFAGDITCTIGGPSLPEDMTVVVAEADYAVTFEVEVSDVSIDYRNVAVGDIVIKEAFAGALKEDTVLTFVADVIEFEGTAKVVVEEGDIEVKVEDKADGKLTLTVEDESYKAPAVVRLTNVEAYLHRALPAGSYDLKVSSNGKSLFENYSEKTVIKTAYKNQTTTSDDWANFPVNKYTLADAYIEVVTASRDKDESTFTTAVKVTVGANTMTVLNVYKTPQSKK